MTSHLREGIVKLAGRNSQKKREIVDAYHGRSESRYSLPIMIHPYSNETQTRWDRGDFKVQLNQPNNTRPMGFCDGSDSDVSEQQAMAESEGADEMRIERKLLKSGRELWTLHGGGGAEEFE